MNISRPPKLFQKNDPFFETPIRGKKTLISRYPLVYKKKVIFLNDKVKLKGKKMKLKKLFLKQNNQTEETGRSMVEMLGVLAIIGVLSIGGIAGYTIAMNRYRANEIIDTASKVAIIAMSKPDCKDSVCAYMNEATTRVNVAGVVSMQGFGNGEVGIAGSASPSLRNALKSIGGNKIVRETYDEESGETFTMMLNFEKY